MSDVQLQIDLDDALRALCAHRPLELDLVDRVHEELLLLFNHFSLKHEGNNLGIDETKMVTDLLSKKNSKRPIEDEEINDKIEKIPRSQNDIKEAVNHILVSGQLLEMAKND
jgi:Trp operon repressor